MRESETYSSQKRKRIRKYAQTPYVVWKSKREGEKLRLKSVSLEKESVVIASNKMLCLNLQFENKVHMLQIALVNMTSPCAQE